MSDGFLSRWARLKDQARRTPPETPPELPAEVPAGPVEGAPAAEAAPTAEAEADALRRLLDSLPKLEELTRDTDVRLFFQKGVPDALRNAALKRVWALDPEVNRFSEMAEYAWDWNTPGGAPSFGPLEEGFDVAGMLKGILPDREDYGFDPDKRAPDQSLDRDMLSQDREAEGPAAEPVDAASQQDGGPDIVADSDEAPADSAANEPANSEAVAPQVAVQEETSVPASAPVRAPRRHGGALPG